MELKKIQSVRLIRGKRFLVRCDLNVKLSGGTLSGPEMWKLKSSLPTLERITRKGGRIIIVAHRGRPKGVDHDLTLAPLIRPLAARLNKKIALWPFKPHTWRAQSSALKNGDIAVIENIRFDKRETAGDPRLGKLLGSLADVYVNDAFGNIHRAHASMVAVTRHLPSYAGLLLQYELDHLYELLDRAPRPLVAIVGGNKISTKIRLLKKLLRRVDYLLLGGALANNVLAAMEHNVGKSKIEPDMIAWSKNLMSNKLRVPVDARVATSLSARPRMRPVGRVENKDMILDVGPDTVKLYSAILAQARTVIWNGPLGYCEDDRYAKATRDVITLLTKISARSYVGGGETVKAVLEQRAEKKLHFISTGGGAMLSLLESKVLPGLRPLVKRW